MEFKEEVDNFEAEPQAKKLKIDDTKSVSDSSIPIENNENQETETVESQDQSKTDGSQQSFDPLGYTKTGAFTSEIFKIVIKNVHKYLTSLDIKKKLQHHELESVKVKRPHHSNYAYVTFRDEETRQLAIKTLDQQVWKKRTIQVAEAEPDLCPFAMNEARGDNKAIDNRTVREKTAPLYLVNYDEQLKLKLSEIQSVLVKYKESIKNEWCAGFPEDDYKFDISTIKPSPVLMGYRNKCEFTVGKNTESGDESCVGFVKGSFSQGNISIESPADCKETCSDVMMEEVAKFKEFVTASEFAAYDNIKNVGVWKALEIRTTQSGDLMITPIVDKRYLNCDSLEKLKNYLKACYDERAEKFSLFLRLIGGKEEIYHLSGPEFMLERLCGFDFQITSGSFFQVNTPCAETLYETIRDTAKLDKNTVLLDICCGTGTIGIILSKYVQKVYGIELVESAVEDAKKNAERNDIDNITFIAGNAKITTPRVIKSIPMSGDTRVVAVVDPPRNGLHSDVISCLRKNTFISEIVYVSCDIKLATNNIVRLCGPTSTRYPEDPFKFVSCVAVDLFPHTKRFEVIFHLNR